MRIAYFTLPTVNNDGIDQTDTHTGLRNALCESFGGFTATRGDGGWRSDTGKLYLDPVMVYGIAMEDSLSERSKLESIALFYGDQAGQLAVMVTHAAGDVVFLDVPATVGKAVQFT